MRIPTQDRAGSEALNVTTAGVKSLQQPSIQRLNAPR
jgi:hypothetical protein